MPGKTAPRGFSLIALVAGAFSVGLLIVGPLVLVNRQGALRGSVAAASAAGWRLESEQRLLDETPECFSHDGAVLVTALKNETLRLWDARTGDLLQSIPCGKYQADCSFSPNDRMLIARGDAAARVWDVSRGSPLYTLPETSGTKLVTAIFSLDGRQVLTVTEGGSSRLWDASSGAPDTTGARGMNGFGSGLIRHWPELI